MTLSQVSVPIGNRMDRHEEGPEGPVVHAMKRSKFTDEQIAFALKQAELGVSVDEVCRKMGISEATFYVWRKKYGAVWPVRASAIATA